LQPFLVQALAALARNKPEKPLKFLADFLIEHNPNKPTPPPPGGAGQGAGAGVRAPVGVAIVGDSKSKVITKDEK
jgi:hypothetical protein